MQFRQDENQRFDKILMGCVTLLLLLLASGCGQPTPKDTRSPDEATIRDLDAQWSQMAGTRNVDGAVAFYSDDAALLPPNAPIATDKQSIRAEWVELLAPNSSLSWLSNKVDVARSGDLGYSMGAYQMTIQGQQGKLIEDHGKFLEVWKKQADGKWKVVADVYNSDIPLPAPVPPPQNKSAHHKQSHKKSHSKSHSGHS